MAAAIIGSDLKVDFIGLHSLLKALGLSSKNNFCYAVVRVGLILRMSLVKLDVIYQIHLVFSILCSCW